MTGMEAAAPAAQPATSTPSTGELVAAILLGGLAVTQVVAMPLLAPLLAGTFGAGGEDAGLIGLGNLLGTALGSLVVTLRLNSLAPRQTAIAATLLACLAQLAVWFAPGFGTAMALETLAGLGAGVLMALSAAIVGAARDPDRGFAFILALQAAVAVIVLLAIPPLSAAGSLAAVIAFLVAVQAILLPVCFLLGAAPASAGAGVSVSMTGSERRRVALQAGSYFAFSAAVGVVWVFSGVLGTMAGIGEGPIGQALAVGNIAAVIGSLLAALITTRFGRLAPLAAVCLILLAGVALFSAGMSVADFYLASNLYLFAWGCGLPLFMGAVAEADPTDRVTALLPVMSFAGMGVGPALAGVLPLGGLFAQVLVTTVVFLLAAMLLAAAARFLQRSAQPA